MQGNATFLELLFTVIGAVGLLSVFFGLPSIIGDLNYARQRRQLAMPARITALEVKLKTAQGNLRREVGRLVTLSSCTALGAYLCTRPQYGPNNTMTVPAIISAFVILQLEFDATFQSIMDRVDRGVLQGIVLGSRRTLEEVIQAELQLRRRANDPPPTMPEKDA